MSSLERKNSESGKLFITDDAMENVIKLLPLKRAIMSSLVSKRFLKSWCFCQDLDFGSYFALTHSYAKCIAIVKKVFEEIKASKIKRLSLSLPYSAHDDLIQSWIVTCAEKGIEELELEFLIGSQLFISVDISSIQTLRVLKLSGIHHFDMQFSTQLKFLETISLSRIFVALHTIISITRNCLCLVNLELIECHGIADLLINTTDNTRFTSLTVACCPDISLIELDSPSLKSFRFSGFAPKFKFGDLTALKDVMLHFNDMNNIDTFNVVDCFAYLSGIEVLTISTVFLEGLMKKSMTGRRPRLNYLGYSNLKEIQILMEGQSFCSLYDLVHMVKNCPKLQRVYMDLNNFDLEPRARGDVDKKPLLYQLPWVFNNLKFVEIRGFRNHWRELDLVQLFLERSPELRGIVLVGPKDATRTKAELSQYHYHRLNILRKRNPSVMILVSEDAAYKCIIPPTHTTRWYFCYVV